MSRVLSLISPYRPCGEAKRWAEHYDDPARAWAECERGDWMLWWAGRLSGPPWGEGRKRLVMVACACARLVLPLITDVRVLTCIEVAERWARGEAAPDEVYAARTAYPAYATAAAADTADAAAYAAYAAAYVAAAYVAAAAYDAAAAAERARVLRECADLVRQSYVNPPLPKEDGR